MLEPGTHLLGRPVAGSKPARSHPASSAKPYGTRRDADSLLAWILRAPEAVFGPGPYLPLRLLGEVAGSKPGLPPYSKEQCKTNFSPHLSLLGNTDSGRSLLPVPFSSHRFRRIFATEAVANGPRLNRRQTSGHQTLASTQIHLAAYDNQVIEHNRAFIAHRITTRPNGEHRNHRQPPSSAGRSPRQCLARRGRRAQSRPICSPP